MNKEDSSQSQHSHDLEFLTKGVLIRNRAEPQAPRQYVYKQNADVDSLIEACSRKLEQQPGNSRALMIRASSFIKKGMRRCGRRADGVALAQGQVSCAAGNGHRRGRPWASDAGLLDAACADYSAVLGLDPHNAEAAYARGTVLQKLGQVRRRSAAKCRRLSGEALNQGRAHRKAADVASSANRLCLLVGGGCNSRLHHSAEAGPKPRQGCLLARCLPQCAGPV